MGGGLRIRSLSSADKPRERLVNIGTQALSDLELLAIILGSGSNKESVLSLAGRVLRGFGGLRGLCDVDIHQLLAVSGIGLAKAASIKAVCEISLRMQTSTLNKKLTITKPLDVFVAVKRNLYGKKKEYLYLLSLDARSNLVAMNLISIGTITEALVHPREVFKQALLKDAVSIVLVHNHPSGDPTPSKQDVLLTKRIATVGISLGVPLIDHIICCDDSFLSLKVENYLNRGEVIK